jgi:glycosyltransferase involved in cell wall biosynthesis
LSVVVPALNEERHVGNLLSDIAAQTRQPDETFVVDAGSSDDTIGVVRGFPWVDLLPGEPPVARGRNRGGFAADGDVIVFLDADVRLEETFFERLLLEMDRRALDVACPEYWPHDSTPGVRLFHAGYNALVRLFERSRPSGAGCCIAVRGDLFRASAGFDPSLKFDDIELVRRLSRGRRFGILREGVFVSDRRFREHGTAKIVLQQTLMGCFFVIGRFEWANYVTYEFGKHKH